MINTRNNNIFNRATLHEAKSEILLREAISAFNKQGYHATSMQEIGRRLGVTKATLYHYFPSKQALLAAAFQHVLEIAFSSLEAAEARGGTGFDKLQYTIQTYIVSAYGETSPSIIIAEEHALDEERHRDIVEKRDLFECGLRNLVREGIADGSVVPCDPKLAIFTIFGAVNWVPKWFSGTGEWTNSQLATAMSELACRSIAARPKPTLDVDVGALDSDALRSD